MLMLMIDNVKNIKTDFKAEEHTKSTTTNFQEPIGNQFGVDDDIFFGKIRPRILLNSAFKSVNVDLDYLDSKKYSGFSSSDYVKEYLKEIGKVPLLNSKEEIELARIIANAVKARAALDSDIECITEDEKRKLRRAVHYGALAKNNLLKANLRLVVSLAKRYMGHGMTFLDLIQEGNLGLIKAVEKFDYRRGFKFSTYATWWLKQAMTRAMADQVRTIRIPVHMVELINRIARIQRETMQTKYRDASADEIAELLSVSKTKIVDIQRHVREPISLQSPINDDGDSSFTDIIEDTNASLPFKNIYNKTLNKKLH
jgi:RNA polymerase primary sigma factor